MENGFDIVNFIKTNSKYFNSKSHIKNIFMWYILVIRYLLSEKVNIIYILKFVGQCILASQSLVNFKWCPWFLKIKRSDVDCCCSQKFLEHIFKKNANQDVVLFGEPLLYLPNQNMSWAEKYYSFYILLFLVKEVIVDDQYNAINLIKDGDVVIDAGALIGDFSIWVNYLYSNAKIYAFEPSPKIFSLANKNTGIRSPNIHTLNLALGAGNDNVTFSIGNNIGLWGGDAVFKNQFVKNRIHSFGEQVVVKMITLDNFLKDEKLPKVDFIKIDTEGYEKEVIEGARDIIKTYKPVIVCAAYHFKDDFRTIPKLISEINPNYSYFLIKGTETDLVFIPK